VRLRPPDDLRPLDLRPLDLRPLDLRPPDLRLPFLRPPDLRAPLRPPERFAVDLRAPPFLDDDFFDERFALDLLRLAAIIYAVILSLVGDDQGCCLLYTAN